MICPRVRGVPRGVTFIEVILSIVILTVGVVAVQKTLLNSFAAMSLIENWDQAEELLQQKVWEIKREAVEKPKTLGPIQQRSVLLGKDRTYNYDLVVRSGAAEEGLWEAYAKVSWESKGIRHSLPRFFYLRALHEKDAKDPSRI
ncbi:MAG: hypothetical protein KTQ49_07395 [Candidatus Omnitrophica bacterium]|nr:hypothetical protein [Candidatus Omnitrophota bacterium]